MSVDNENRPFPLVLGPTGERELGNVQLDQGQVPFVRQIAAIVEYNGLSLAPYDFLVPPLLKWFKTLPDLLKPEHLPRRHQRSMEDFKSLKNSQSAFMNWYTLAQFGIQSLKEFEPWGQSLVSVLLGNPDQRSVLDIVHPFYHGKIQQFTGSQSNKNLIPHGDQTRIYTSSRIDTSYGLFFQSLVERVTPQGEEALFILRLIGDAKHLGPYARISLATLKIESPEFHPEGDKAIEAYILALVEFFIRKRGCWLAEGKITKDKPIQLGNAGTLNFYSQPRLEEVIEGELAAKLPFSAIFGGIYLTLTVMSDRIDSLKWDQSADSMSRKLDLVTEYLKLKIFSDKQIRKYAIWKNSPDRQGGTGGELLTCADFINRIDVTNRILGEKIEPFMHP